MELDQNLANFFSNKTDSGGGGASPAPAAASGGLSSDFRDFFPSTPKSQGGGKRSGVPLDPAKVESIADQERLNPAQKRMMKGLLGQESDNGANATTSTDGAVGVGQIIPGTWKRYAKAGEDPTNDDHNLAVMARIVKDLGTKFGDDPARMATGYFSGDGNVNVGGTSAWKNDARDGNGKSVSSYVSDVLKRLDGIPMPEAKAAAPAKALPDLGQAKPWGDIAKSREFRDLPPEQQQLAKSAYFDYWIAPHAGAHAGSMRQQFMGAENPSVGMLDRAGEMLGDASNAVSKVANAATDAAPGVMDNVKGAARAILGLENPSIMTPGSIPNMDLPSTSKAPVDTKFRDAFNAQWDAATEDQRRAMMTVPGMMGQLARDRAGRFGQTEALTDKTQPGSMADRTDPRIEERRQQLIRQGEDPAYAARAAAEATPAGVAPGAETGFLQTKYGTLQKSEITQAEKAIADAFSKQTGLNNPLARGAAKAVVGTGKGIAGLYEMMYDGIDTATGTHIAAPLAAGARTVTSASRSVETAMGERGDFLSRNLEGAISSIGQQLPWMLKGVKAGSTVMPILGIGLNTMGGEFSDARAAGMDYLPAITRASIYSAFEMVGEFFGLGDTIKAMRGATHGMSNSQIVELFGSALRKELPGELFTATGEFAVDKWAPFGMAMHPEWTMKDYLGQVADTIAQTFMQSGVMGGATTGVGTAHRYMTGVGGVHAGVAEADAQRARTEAMNKAEEMFGGRVEPTVQTENGDGTVTSSAPGITVRYTDPNAPAPHATSQTADSIVGELAAQHGVPLDTVLPPSTPVGGSPVEAPISDQDVLDFADRRHEQLLEKRDGYGLGEDAVAGKGLTPSEQQEINFLASAGDDAAVLRHFYGLTSPTTTPQSQENQNAQSTQQAPQPGAAPSTDASSPTGQPSGATPVSESAPGSEAAANDASNAERSPGQQIQGGENGSLLGKREGSSEQFNNYMRRISEGVAITPGLIEQIRMEERLNDGEAEELIALARAKSGKPRTEKEARQQREEKSGTQAAQTEQAEAQGSQAPAADITAAAHEAATSPHNDLPEPTAAQKEAGNYKKGHVTFDGLDLTIENPVGSTRSGTDPNGQDWSVPMTAHYGYMKRTEGADGEHIDVYVAEHPKEGSPVFVFDQHNLGDSKFDEHKVVLGAGTLSAAQDIYDAHFSDGQGHRRREGGRQMTVDEFKAWAKSDESKKPVADATVGKSTNGFMRNIDGEWVDPLESIRSIINAGFTKLVEVKKTGWVELYKPGTNMGGHGFRPSQADDVRRELAAKLAEKPKTEKDAKAQRDQAKEDNRHWPQIGSKTFNFGRGQIDIIARRISDRFLAFELRGEGVNSETGFLSRAGVPYQGEMTPERLDALMLRIAEENQKPEPKPAKKGKAKTEKEAKAKKDAEPKYPRGPASRAPKVDDLKTYTTAEAKKEWDKLTPSRRSGMLARLADKIPAGWAEKSWDEMTPEQRKYAHEALNEDFFAPAWYFNKAGEKVTRGEAIKPIEKTPAQIEFERGEAFWEGLPRAQRFTLLLDAGMGKDAEEGKYAKWGNLGEGVRKRLMVHANNMQDVQDFIEGKTDAPPELPSNKPAVSANTIFTEDAAEKARALLKSKLKSQLNSGIDPELMQAGITLTGYHIEKGARTFAAYAKAMIADLGDVVKPYLKSWYMAVKFDPRAVELAKDMDQSGDVEKADVEQVLAQSDSPIVKTYPGDSNTQIEVIKNNAPDTYSVGMRDLDSGNLLPTLRRFTGADALDKATAYAESIASKQKDKPKAAPGKADLTTAEGRYEVAKQISEHFLAGKAFASILDARKMIAQITGLTKIEAGTEMAKLADESIEAGVVIASRDIVFASRYNGRSPQQTYERLLALYDRQPNLAVRSSTSIREQAYSTPIPLAYVASQLAGITEKSSVYEPTAGNGMLLVGANPTHTTANELNPRRFSMLQYILGDKGHVTADNAAYYYPAGKYDAVIANPPFGITKDGDGQTLVYEVAPDYGTREVDHAIAFKALATMKDDGRAVLIVGGVMAESEEGRREDYRAKSKRSFYYKLYQDYNVVDHFTIDGDMYSKQGASFPVDVIVIQGRGKSSRELPASDLPHVIKTYEELKEKLNAKDSVDAPGDHSGDGSDRSPDQPGTSDGNDVAGSPGRPDGGNGAQGSRPGRGSGSSVRGTRSGSTGQRAPTGTVPSTGQPSTEGVAGRSDDGRKPVSDNGEQQQPGSTASDRGNDTSGLGEHGGLDGERVGAGLKDRRGQEQETETQAEYVPFSKAPSVGTLVPRAMRDSIAESLQRVETEVGDIDQYVSDALDMTIEQAHAAFSAEQIDALALAIKNAQEGLGFIIGDQTGIGKGRVVAAMMRYALVGGKTPIFITEKPNLYADMIRDLDDIGMTGDLRLDTKNPAILMTNADKTIPYVLLRKDSDGQPIEHDFNLKFPKGGKPDTLMKQMQDGNSLGDYKVIFTTYSQLQTVKGKVTERQRLINHFASGNYVIFDESHNAGGTGADASARGGKKEPGQDQVATGRAGYARGLVNKAYGTFFSSATYAKRPDVMDLYSSTNMKLAVDKLSQLAEAIKKGGVPMQQVVANMLTQDGQYIRRERTFAGVSYDTKETKVDKKTAENMATAMRRILQFSRAKELAVKTIQKDLDKDGKIAGAVGERTTVQGANFGSIMHNLIDQMLLALKVEDSVRYAIERLKAGEKVVLTVSNTMGSFLKDYADEMGLNNGDPIALSFKDLYIRYLEKQRVISIKAPNGQVTKHRLTDDELGPGLTALFNDIRGEIEQSGFGAAPISPIDYMRSELEKAGFKTDEITGRTASVKYTDGQATLSSRNSDIRQRLKAVRGFNNGEVDALILNQAGSTGLSLHASERVKDQRKRHMIVVQAEKNIDTHMQMLGRVHRTGQVIAPAYSQMMADIPAEIRPAAVLLKKMASLSANTTASRKSAVTAEGVVDFMNDYGGIVAAEYLRDNQDVHGSVGGGKVIPLAEEDEGNGEDLIRKFTGYIPILPIAKQEEVYRELSDRYNELIERENSMGTNKLEAKALDLDAETISSKVITEEHKNSTSIFAQPAKMERVDVKRTVKPMTSDEVTNLVKERLGGKTAAAIKQEMLLFLNAHGHAFITDKMVEIGAFEMDAVKRQQIKDTLDAIYNRAETVLRTYAIGDPVTVKQDNGLYVHGVIVDMVHAGRTANPAAGSSWKMTIALADGDAKTLKINFGQVGTRYSLSVDPHVEWYNPDTQKGEYTSILSLFDKGGRLAREKRWMVTGNLLAGFAKHPGQIVSYTKKDGTIAQGVLMSRQFDFDKEHKNAPVRLKTADAAMKFLTEGGYGALIGTEDKNIRVSYQGGRFNFLTPSSKKDGGQYFLDKKLSDAIGSEFYKRGSLMQANTRNEHEARAAIEYLLRNAEDPLFALNNLEKARDMLGMGDEGGVLNNIRRNQIEDMSRSPAAGMTGLSESTRGSAAARLTKLQEKLDAGKMTEAEFVLAVRMLTEDLKDKADERKYQGILRERRRGPEWVRSKLQRGLADEALTPEEVGFATWLLDQNPMLANGLGISVRQPTDSAHAAGNYNPVSRVMTLFSEKSSNDTPVHEILHHTERMMPREVQNGIVTEWQRSWEKAFRKAGAKEKAALIEMLHAAYGNGQAQQKTMRAFRDRVLNYNDHYQLYSPSEFWAVNGARILSGRYNANGSWVKTAIQWFKEFIERAKGAFGLRSDAPVLKGLKDVLNGEGTIKHGSKMLVEHDVSGFLQEIEQDETKPDTKQAPHEFNNIVRRTQRNVINYFANQPDNLRTFGLYDKTLATQFHKALKDKDYGRVFGYANAMQNEVSLTSIRPSELAPAILPRIDNVVAAAKTVVKGKNVHPQMAAAGNALFAGTLYGNTVLDGHVWSDAELRNNFRLNDEGVALYQQGRAAIDASLDEIAAAEAYAAAQGFIPKSMRRMIIDNPQAARVLIEGELARQIRTVKTAIRAAAGNTARVADLNSSLTGYEDAEKAVARIFNQSRMLKDAGYAPLMRFGQYTVTTQPIDPTTGEVLKDADGHPITEFFGQYETQAEARMIERQQQQLYSGQDYRVTAGVKSELSHRLYAGITPETLALFGDVIGLDAATKKYYQVALAERSALKRRLQRKNVAGYAEDMPRVLSNFITSNGRLAANRYYQKDFDQAIRNIPHAKGDVMDEAIKLKEYMNNPKDPAAPVSAALFAWFLGGSVASAAVNLTQPVLMTAPYLSQFGIAHATKAMAEALPMALGKKPVNDPVLREALRRASREGVVDAQEIFHLYSVGTQSVSTGLVNAASHIPIAGKYVKAGSEDARVRINAFLTIWGAMFSAAEGFNRRLTFVAAWKVAQAKGQNDSQAYAFAVRAVNETQGIYNKVNRPNWARNPVGRVVLTFKQYAIMYVELLSRMWKNGGPEGKRAALIMLGVLMLSAGEDNLPFSQDLDDLIDTIGQRMGFDTNVRRSKRRVAHKVLGKALGDLFLYGISSYLPIDFSNRLGLGNLIPGSDVAKLSNTDPARSLWEVGGAGVGLGQQVGDAMGAFGEGNIAKGFKNLAPTAIRNALDGAAMLHKGHGTDVKGRRTVDTTTGDALGKMIGFNPTTVAQETRKTMPLQQDINLQRHMESSILDNWARAATDGDRAAIAVQEKRLAEWNRDNPEIPIIIHPDQIRNRVRMMNKDKDTRMLKGAPREMRGKIGLELMK